MSITRRLLNVMQQYKHAPEVAYLLADMLKDMHLFDVATRVFPGSMLYSMKDDELGSDATGLGRPFEYGPENAAVDAACLRLSLDDYDLYDGRLTNADVPVGDLCPIDYLPKNSWVMQDERRIRRPGQRPIRTRHGDLIPNYAHTQYNYATSVLVAGLFRVVKNKRYSLNGERGHEFMRVMNTPTGFLESDELLIQSNDLFEVKPEDTHVRLHGPSAWRGFSWAKGSDLYRDYARQLPADTLQKRIDYDRDVTEFDKLKLLDDWADPRYQRKLELQKLFKVKYPILSPARNIRDMPFDGRDFDLADYFSANDYAPSRMDIIIPWLAKVINAWFKAADKIQIPIITIDQVRQLPCVKLDTDGLSAFIQNPASQPYRELMWPAVTPLVKSVIHHSSLAYLKAELSRIVKWVSDPDTKVDLLKLSVGDAYRASKKYMSRKMLTLDIPSDKALLFRDGDYYFYELISAEQLTREGEAMSHSVGNRGVDVESGKTQIVSMRRGTVNGGERIATIDVELNPKARGGKGNRIVRQVFKSANRQITDPAERMAVARFMKYTDSTPGEGYGDSAMPYLVELNRLATTDNSDVLAGLWDLALEGGIHSFVSSFGRR